MSVNVSYKGTVRSYGVSRAMLVQNLKQQISESQKLHQFKLMIGQAELLNTRLVIKYLFTKFTLCYDNKETAVEINDFTLGLTVVNPEDQRLINQKATPEMTVRQLKEWISTQLSNTQGNWTLKKDGREIPDGDLLKTHIAVKTFTVNIQEMQVFIIETVQNCPRQYSIATRSDMTILEFKRLCVLKIGKSVEEIGFVFNGRYLDPYEELTADRRQQAAKVVSDAKKAEMKAVYEASTLGSFQIEHNSFINIIIKLKGGLTRL